MAISGMDVRFTERGDSLTIKDSSFGGFNNSLEAGLVYADGDGFILVENSLFHDIGGGEGGVFNLGNQVEIEIVDSVFRNNTAGRSAGVLLASGELNVTITNCTFASNYGFHGGVFFFTQTVNYNITDSVFESNRADGYGAVIYIMSLRDVRAPPLFSSP